MKNKLLVSVFAVVIASLAFTSCESKSDVMGVNTDLLKRTLHGINTGTSAARGYVEMNGQNLIIEEYEFPSKDVNDSRLLYRRIVFGDGVYEPKKVDTLSYEYGDWQDQNTVFTLFVTPKENDPYILKYLGDGLITPSGRVYGGSSAANVARVEKLESVISTLPNTMWEGTYRAEFVLDSVYRDSIRTTFIPPMTFIIDTIQIFDHMDTVSADTTCLYRWTFNRDANNYANTGHLYRKSTRSSYDRETKQEKIISMDEYEYDFHWMIPNLSSDKKFYIQLTNTTKPEEDGKILSISKYELDAEGVPSSFLLDGVNYQYTVQP